MSIKFLSSISADKILSGTTCVASPTIETNWIASTGGAAILNGADFNLIAPAGSNDTGDIVFYSGGTMACEWARLWATTTGCLLYRSHVTGLGNAYCMYHTGNINGATVGTSICVASGTITDLNAVWTGYTGGNLLTVNNYGVGATNKPVTVDNANWLFNIYSHPSEGTRAYGHQITGVDNENIYFRHISNGTIGNWRCLYHSGNLPASSSALSGLTDVTISSPTEGDILRYYSGTSKWCNDEPTDITSNLGTGDLLYYNGQTISGATLVQSSSNIMTLKANCLNICSSTAQKYIQMCPANCTSALGNLNIIGAFNSCCWGGGVCMLAGCSAKSAGIAGSMTGAIASIVAGCVNYTLSQQVYAGYGGAANLKGGDITMYCYYGYGGDVCIIGGCSFSIVNSTTYAYGGDVCIFAGDGCACGGHLYLSPGDSTQGTTYDGNIFMCRLKTSTASYAVLIDTAGCVSYCLKTSDCRLKCNLQPITGTTLMLDHINSYSAEYYNTSSALDGTCKYVLLAQEIENDLPFAVEEDVEINETIYKRVDYEQMIPVIWGIVKEQQAQICNLQQEINTLKNCF